MPPQNDNFANAQALNADNGTLIGTNVGATAEAGEPANNGHTVWYSWSPSQNLTGGYIFFGTLPQSNALTKPLLRSEIRIFVGIATGFAEIAPSFGAHSQYGGVSLGGYLIFPNPEPGNTIYIRIDSSPNSTPGVDDQGSFLLTWGPSNGPPMLGNCNTCSSELGMKVQCLATLQMPYPLTSGDIRGGVAFAMQRGPSLNLPAGTYMLRYCGGFYYFASEKDFRFGSDQWWGVYAFTNSGSSGQGTGYSLLFHSGYADGLTLSPSPTAPPSAGQYAGDFSIGFRDAGVQAYVGAAWWDGAKWQPGDGSGYPNWDNIGTGFGYPGHNPSVPGSIGGGSVAAAPLISAIQNPCIQSAVGASFTDPNVPSWFPQGDVPADPNSGEPEVGTEPVPAQPNSPFVKSPPFILAEYGCEANIFHHAGGKMNWVSQVCLGDAFYVDSNGDGHIMADGIGVDLTPLFTIFIGGSAGQQGPACRIWVPNAGAPTYNLMRILPDLSLVAGAVVNNFEQNPTANGEKNCRFDLTVKNNSIVGWSNVTFTPSGFYTTQDGNAYPTSGLQTFTLAANAITDLFVAWNMTNPVGTVTIALSDADGNPLPTFTVNVTPLFAVTSTQVFNQFTLNGQKYRSFAVNLSNIGNGTTRAVQFVISGTANGNPIQIGLNQGFPPPPTAPGLTWSPFLGNTDPINPSGLGLGWNPGSAGVVQLYVPVTDQNQTVIVTLTPSDTGNNLPPMQATVKMPAAS